MRRAPPPALLTELIYPSATRWGRHTRAGAAGATALGLGLVAFGRPPWVKVLAPPVMVLPHLIGAPLPSEHGGSASAELTREFVIASLATTCLFWIALGTMSGWLYRRLAGSADSR